MTFFTHSISAGLIAYAVTSVNPVPGLIWACLLPAALLDLDHLYYILKDYKKFKKPIGTLHEARSPLHEVAGIGIISITSLIISFWNPTLAIAIGISISVHILEDMIMGISRPYYPLNKDQIKFFNFTFNQKVLIELSVLIISIFLWTKYL